MSKRTIIVLSSVLIVILGIVIGVLIYRLNSTVLISDDTNVVNDIVNIDVIDNITINDDVINTDNQEEKSSPNAKMTFETYYIDCGHTVLAKEVVSEEEVNKDESYFKNAYSDWEIKSFAHDSITLYKEVQGNCGKHYLIKEENGFIAVYTINADGSQTLKETTHISTQYLPEADLAILKVGIKANGDAELNQKLEDFE